MIPHVRASTPSRPSPITRTSNPRSPTKSTTRPDLSLSLSSIIGSTCSSTTRFSSDSASSSLAYAAGAAVVLATVDDKLSVEQRFFRAVAGLTVAKPLADGPDNGVRSGTPIRDDVRRLVGVGRGRAGSPFTGKPSSNVMNNEVGEGSPTSGHAKDKVKAATAVALSPGGRWLAIGETGYRPRVLLFLVTEKKSTEQPVAILLEHSFGVQAIAWEHTSRLMATLGTVNDGFLFVWNVDDSGKTTLLASNKCTTIVKDMKWMGRCLVTAGVRFVKIWRPDEIAPSMGVEGDKDGLSHPGYKPLVGRNVLIGDMLEATFTAVVPLNDIKAVLCSDAGDVCILDDSDKQQRLTRIAIKNFGITAACLHTTGQLIVTGTNGEIEAVDLTTTVRSQTPISRSGTPISRRPDKSIAYSIAAGALSNVLVTVDTKHSIHFHQPDEHSVGSRSFARISSQTSHSDAILGLRTLAATSEGSATFATWSSGGSIIGWSVTGKPVFQLKAPLEQIDDAYELTNELRSIAFFPDTPVVATGDRYGVLRLLDMHSGEVKFDARAHSSEITDICINTAGKESYLATASRDRTIQVFVWQDEQLELIQTLDEHAGAVTQLAFSEDGKHLLSCSADRTVVVRDAAEGDAGEHQLFVMVRAITLKAAPAAMDFAAQVDQIIVSTADRLVCLIDYQTGRTLSTFKTGDNEGGDPVTLSGLVHVTSGAGPSMVAGVSSADKSVRIYSEEGTLLARDWGHTEGVTDITLLRSTDENKQRLISVAADGTIFIWSTQTRKMPPSAIKSDDIFASVSSSSPLARPPLRKVISQSEMSRLRRSMVSPSADNEPDTPTGLRSPPPAGLRKRPSRLSMGQPPQLNAPVARSTTPTDSGSPIARTRSPSPARSQQQLSTRSPARSPERNPRRRTSQVDLKKELPNLEIRPMSLAAEGLAPSREPSKEPETADNESDELSKRAEEVVGVLRHYRSALRSSQPRILQSQIYSSLRGELESLLRTMSLQEMAPVQNQNDSGIDCDVNGGSESTTDNVDVLESVEERSEVF